MGLAVGIDVAKESHWVRAIGSERSEPLLDRRVDVLHAMLRNREPYRARTPVAA